MPCQIESIHRLAGGIRRSTHECMNSPCIHDYGTDGKIVGASQQHKIQNKLDWSIDQWIDISMDRCSTMGCLPFSAHGQVTTTLYWMHVCKYASMIACMHVCMRPK